MKAAVTLLALIVAATTARAKAVELEPRVVFRFGAGTGMFARPGVGQGGNVYVGAGDGYVHALWPDGSYRWSFTVKGRVAAPPLEDASTGRAYVLTSEARLYSLEADSHLRWVFPLPVAPKSEMTLTPKGWLLFVGQDDHLYGVTTGGALVLRLAATGARSSPVTLENGRPALVLNDSIATLQGYGYERVPLPTGGSASWLGLGADRAVFACENGKARIVFSSQTELSAKSDCLAAPVRGDGFFAVPEASGNVRLVYSNGASLKLPIGASPLRPVWDAPRRRLILSSATGSVTVYELPAGEPER